MTNLINNKILSFIIFAIPLSITVGIAVTEALCLIVTLYFFFYVKNLKFLYDEKIIFLFFLAFYYALIAYLKIDGDLRYSSYFYFRYIFISLSILILLDHIKFTNKTYALVIFIFCFLIMLDAWLQFITGKNLLGFEIIKQRISGIFGDDLILGGFFVKIFPFLVWLIFYFKIDILKNQNILLFFFSSCFITVYLSSERTAFALLLMSILLFLFLIKDLRKLLLKSLIILLFSIIIIYSFKIGKTDPATRLVLKSFHQITNYKFVEDLHETPQELIEKVNKRKQSKLYNNKLVIFSVDHTQHFILAYDLFKKSPYIGAGPKGFRNHCRNVLYVPKIGFCSTHPHNIIVQLLSETGIIGLSLFLLGYFFVIIKLIKYKFNELIDENRSYNQFYLISIGILINLFPLLPSGNYFNNWLSIMNFYYIGLYLFMFKKIN